MELLLENNEQYATLKMIGQYRDLQDMHLFKDTLDDILAKDIKACSSDPETHLTMRYLAVRRAQPLPCLN